MERIKINEKEYIYETEVRQKESIRASFNQLTKKTFGFDFKEFYESGNWKESYRPHVLMDHGKVIANVSVSTMDFSVQGEVKKFIQLGTVMTADEYKGLGLSRILMEKVIEQWREDSDLIFLFANDEVLEFYPKFGFKKAEEIQHFKKVTGLEKVNLCGDDKSHRVRKLDMESKDDRGLFTRSIKTAKNFSSMELINNMSMTMFYCTWIMKHNVYYIDEIETSVVATIEEGTLTIIQVFSPKISDLEEIMTYFMTDEINKVVYGFTPKEADGYESVVVDEEDTTLFILGEDPLFMKREGCMFPVLCHA